MTHCILSDVLPTAPIAPTAPGAMGAVGTVPQKQSTAPTAPGGSSGREQWIVQCTRQRGQLGPPSTRFLSQHPTDPILDGFSASNATSPAARLGALTCSQALFSRGFGISPSATNWCRTSGVDVGFPLDGFWPSGSARSRTGSPNRQAIAGAQANARLRVPNHQAHLAGSKRTASLGTSRLGRVGGVGARP